MENETNLTEGQRKFFEDKQSFLDAIIPETDTEVELKGLALFLLKDNRNMQEKNNRLRTARAAAIERAMVAEKDADEARNINADKMSKAFGAMVACYRAIDRHFGDEIRSLIKKNFETQEAGEIKKHMAEIERIMNRGKNDA